MATGELEKVSQGAVAPWIQPTQGPVGSTDKPLDDSSLGFLDEVIADAELMTGLRFAVYLGELGTDTRGRAVELHRLLGHDAPYATLLALDPGQRVVEVVTGVAAARRITDRAARVAVLSVVASAGEGDLTGALTGGIRALADQAGTLPERTRW